MPRTLRIGALVMLIAALTAGSSVYADQHTTPSAPEAAPGMMQEGGMGGTGMEGMTGMMDQMSKMMSLCTKMMEGTMMQMDQENALPKTP